MDEIGKRCLDEAKAAERANKAAARQKRLAPWIIALRKVAPLNGEDRFRRLRPNHHVLPTIGGDREGQGPVSRGSGGIVLEDDLTKALWLRNPEFFSCDGEAWRVVVARRFGAVSKFLLTHRKIHVAMRGDSVASAVTGCRWCAMAQEGDADFVAYVQQEQERAAREDEQLPDYGDDCFYEDEDDFGSDEVEDDYDYGDGDFDDLEPEERDLPW